MGLRSVARFARALVWVLLAGGLGCASGASQGAASSTAAPVKEAEPRTPEEVGNAVWSGLQRSDFQGVYARFDDALGTAMPPDQIKQLWKSLVDVQGKLLSWTLREKKQVALKLRLEFDLTLENGRGLGVVAVDPNDLSVAGLFLRPVYR